MRPSAQGHRWDQPAMIIRHDWLKPGRKQDKVPKQSREEEKKNLRCSAVLSTHREGVRQGHFNIMAKLPTPGGRS